MSGLDWLIVIVFIVGLIAAAIYTSRYMRSVASFLSAERCASRYLLALAGTVSGMGTISIVAAYEMYYTTGFVAKWWEMMTIPISLVIALTGWVVYRFRQTRAMTLAQFFEMRYNRKFRVFSGILAFVSGIINFGIFPAIGARFFIYYCHLPAHFNVIGIDISTFLASMIILLSIPLSFTIAGGQITVIVTDFIQGVIFNIVSLVVLLYLLIHFSWPEIADSLLQSPVDQSKVNPFSTSGEQDFNVWYFVIIVVYMFYCAMGWQGSQANACSAKNAHEQKMAGVIAQWRNYVLLLLLVMIPICAYTMMHSPAHAAKAAVANRLLDEISTNVNDPVRKQMLVPIALKAILPNGLVGAMCAIMLASFIGNCTSYLHSWGVIFVQDVIMPFRKKAFETKQHIRILRYAIVGVTVFIIVFSMVFQTSQYIYMFLIITGAIFLGGVGAVVIGGLYWSKGSTSGAFCAMVTGAVIAVSGVIIKEGYPKFFLNGQEMFFLAMVCSSIVYILVSLCGNTRYNMDKLLNRGIYSTEESVERSPIESKMWCKKIWDKLVTDEYSKRDKIFFSITIIWSLLWFIIFVVGSICHSIFGFSDSTWLVFWRVWMWTLFVSAVIITCWLTVGGCMNFKEMFALLRIKEIDATDNGWVEKQPHIINEKITS